MELRLKGRAAAKDRFDAVHIVVNNASGPMPRMDRQITWPDTDWTDDINLKTIGMPRGGSGRIVNISGVASTLVFGTALTHGLNNLVIDGGMSVNPRPA
jgi:hypothetical protein